MPAGISIASAIFTEIEQLFFLDSSIFFAYEIFFNERRIKIRRLRYIIEKKRRRWYPVT